MSHSSAELPHVILVGTGVVGRAILAAHVSSDVSVCVADLDRDSLHDAVAGLGLCDQAWNVTPASIGDSELAVITLRRKTVASRDSSQRRIVIESIAERLPVKQDFFRQAESLMSDDTILCSNTSTLRIASICDGLQRPEQVCGLHFFMPVDQRPAVEVVRGESTSQATIDACVSHVRRINKSPLLVADGPGFIVNRLLSPYLNQSLLLLAHGIDDRQIQRAAASFGMPMSPLELIDFIGTRTMFDAGRAYWQAFPSRMDPSPIVPGLVKAKRFGRSVGKGIYDYSSGRRCTDLPIETVQLCEKYRIGQLALTDQEVVQLLSIPMWIESDLAIRAGVAESIEQVEIAMSGGLGYQHPSGWQGFFHSLGNQQMGASVNRWATTFKSMRATPELFTD